MNKLNTLSIGLLSCLALACVINDDDGGGVDTETGGTSQMTMSTTNAMTTTTMSTSVADDSSGGMTMGQTDDTGSGTVGETDADSGTTAVDPGPFVPDDPDPSLYTRVDRLGMPALNTALISCEDPKGDCAKNDYNNANPADDVMGDFLGEFTASLNFLHGGLDLELSNATDDPTEPGLGLTVCDTSDCAAQALPLVAPDTIKINSANAAGFANGRLLTDQVIDVSLALLLLDLGAHPITTFADVPVNPEANDVDFEKDFPFLAPAH